MKLSRDIKNAVAQAVKPVDSQRVSLSGTAASASAFGNEIEAVLRLCPSIDCFYAINATATTSSVYLPAGTIEYIRIDAGDTLSAITSGATGYLYISEAE